MKKDDWEKSKIQKIRENFNPLIKDNIDVLYHYRTLDGFWRIIESEQFWATNARFSNDQEEQSLGLKKYNEEKKEIIKKSIDSKKEAIKKKEMELKNCKEDSEKIKTLIKKLSDQISKLEDEDNSDSVDDCYIVCFCRSDDKLSQWRAYADGGVSMGMEVGNIRKYDIKSNTKEQYIKYINSCFKVYYINNSDKLSEKLNLQEAQVFKEKGLKTIPYIKHSGFKEEDEYRLVFYNKNDINNNYINISQCINYRVQGDLKIPYVIIDFKTKPDTKGIIHVCGNESDEITKLLKNKLFENDNLNILDCFDEKNIYHDSECDGCLLREFMNPTKFDDYFSKSCCYLRNTLDTKVRKNLVNGILNNSVIIPNTANQKELFNKIDPIIREWNKTRSNKYFIWCEGHLPLRTITVGPCRNQEEVYMSIKHYCKNHYWLNYVIVSKSETPYRKSLL